MSQPRLHCAARLVLDICNLVLAECERSARGMEWAAEDGTAGSAKPRIAGLYISQRGHVEGCEDAVKSVLVEQVEYASGLGLGLLFAALASRHWAL